MKISKNLQTWNRCDKFLWFLTIFMSLYGLVLIKSASRAGGQFFLTHAVCIIFGISASLIVQFIDYRKLSKLWILISMFCTLIIILTLIFGSSVQGASGVDAKAWIKVPGGFTFQPSELAKIGFLFSFAKHLEILKEKRKINDFKSLLLFALHVMIPVFLIHLQKDDGTALIFIFIAIFEMFIAGVDAKFFLISLAIFALLIPVIWNFMLLPYQKNRILSSLDPNSDPYGVGFQRIQSKISIGSGGFLGNGIFQGRRVADGIVPIQESDFIMSVAGEELGFVGCFLMITFLLALIFRISYISRISRDYLGLYSCFGFLGMILSQTIFNIGMCLSFFPVIGVTLPFFSAGGSSIICLFLGIGLVQSIYMIRDD